MRTLAALLLALSGCADVVEHGTTVPLTLRPSCDPSGETFTADSWRVQAATADAEGWTRSFTTFPESIALPKTKDAVLTFEAMQGDQVVARGVSLHVEVNGTGATPQSLVIEVFPVGRITRQCGALNTARSAHTATVLKDGTILIAGGRDTDSTILSSLEVISRTVELAGDIQLVTQGGRFLLPRASHTALALDSGLVMFAGGEQRNMNGGPVPLNTIVFVDPALEFAAGVLGPGPNQAWRARTRHAAFLLGNRVFFVGGLTSNSGTIEPITAVDRLALETNFFEPQRMLPVARDEAAIALTDSEIVLAGGTESGQPARAVQFTALETGAVRETLMREARAGAFAVRIGPRVLIGVGVGASSNFLGTSEWLEGETGPELAPRSKPCAVALENGAFVFGGSDGVGGSSAAEWITPAGDKTSLPFAGQGRFDHSCTKLEDGSVLIAGGRNLGGALNDLWRFVPPP